MSGLQRAGLRKTFKYLFSKDCEELPKTASRLEAIDRITQWKFSSTFCLESLEAAKKYPLSDLSPYHSVEVSKYFSLKVFEKTKLGFSKDLLEMTL